MSLHAELPLENSNIFELPGFAQFIGRHLIGPYYLRPPPIGLLQTQTAVDWSTENFIL